MALSDSDVQKQVNIVCLSLTKVVVLVLNVSSVSAMKSSTYYRN